MTRKFRLALIIKSIFIFTTMTLYLPVAQAAMIGTDGSVSDLVSARGQDDTIKDFLSRQIVIQMLENQGVEPGHAMERVASLTQAERDLLEQKINELPAGAGAVEVIGIVFIVLIILELVGVTDIFKKF